MIGWVFQPADGAPSVLRGDIVANSMDTRVQYFHSYIEHVELD